MIKTDYSKKVEDLFGQSIFSKKILDKKLLFINILAYFSTVIKCVLVMGFRFFIVSLFVI